MDLTLFAQLQTQLDNAKAQAESWKDMEETAKQKLKEMQKLAKQNVDALASKVIFDVGGTLFSTTKDTLLRVKDSYFTSLLESGNWKPQKDGTYFLDRDATCFGRILNYMRYDELDTVGLSVKQNKMLQADFDYFFPNLSLCSGHMNTLKGWLGDGFDASKLLWRGSTDGFTAQAFHSRCDNKGATLTVIKSTNDWIFGGYNPTHWFSNGSWSNCANSFVFTLTNPNGIQPTKYLCHNQGSAVLDNATFGPTFGGGHDLTVWPNGTGNGTGSSYTNFPHGYTDTTGFKNTTFTGKKEFDVKEIEVYAIS